MATTKYEAEVRHDGRLHAFSISNLELPICQACGERVFTEEVDAQVNDGLRAHLNLLTPAQIRDAIKRISMSQKDISKCLGIAEATLSRWLNEFQIQSRAMDHLLRSFFAFPQLRSALCGEEQDPKLGLSDVAVCGGLRSRENGKNRHDNFVSNPQCPSDCDGKQETCRRAQQIIQNTGSTWGKERVA